MSEIRAYKKEIASSIGLSVLSYPLNVGVQFFSTSGLSLNIPSKCIILVGSIFSSIILGVTPKCVSLAEKKWKWDKFFPMIFGAGVSTLINTALSISIATNENYSTDNFVTVSSKVFILSVLLTSLALPIGNVLSGGTCCCIKKNGETEKKEDESRTSVEEEIEEVEEKIPLLENKESSEGKEEESFEV